MLTYNEVPFVKRPDLAIGLQDTALYIMAGIAAALFLSLRFFLFRGAGKAN